MPQTLQDFLNQVQALVTSAYNQGLADGKAQSPDIGAAILKDHQALAVTVADITSKDTAAVTAALAQLAQDIQGSIVPPTPPPPPPAA